MSGQSSCPPPSRTRARLFCAVPSCPDHARPSHGWASFGSMRSRIDAHLAGQLLGDIPMDWLRGLGFSTCEVCQRVLSLRFNGRCPSCFRPFSSQHGGGSDTTRPLAEGAPGVWDVFTSDRRVRSSVPKGAKDAWSRCLIAALADVVAHRDVKSWTDLLTLPALVLSAPSRGGRKHVLRQEGETRRRCLDWLSGIRADLVIAKSPLSFRRVLSVVPVRRFCRTPRSVPQMTSLLLSASFTPVPPLKIAGRWALFGW